MDGYKLEGRTVFQTLYFLQTYIYFLFLIIVSLGKLLLDPHIHINWYELKDKGKKNK